MQHLLDGGDRFVSARILCPEICHAELYLQEREGKKKIENHHPGTAYSRVRMRRTPAFLINGPMPGLSDHPLCRAMENLREICLVGN